MFCVFPPGVTQRKATRWPRTSLPCWSSRGSRSRRRRRPHPHRHRDAPPGPVRSGDGGLSARGWAPARSMTRSARWAPTPASARLRSVGSAPTRMPRSLPFRDRSLADTAFPYVFLDATYGEARVNRRVVSQAVVIATGVAADGHREVLGFAVGDSEHGVLDGPPALAEGPRLGRYPSWSSPMPNRARGRDGRGAHRHQGGPRRPAGLHRLPGRPLKEDLIGQSSGAAEQASCRQPFSFPFVPRVLPCRERSTRCVPSTSPCGIRSWLVDRRHSRFPAR
ncbi:hypothetical protein JOD57_003882 [Geodermatophilus bullaregiensis]|nr:hypothetical protein [Geodermatophilus bullaregiensis]